MRVDLHNHTILCNHATGTVDEYVQRAIELGIDEYGFSALPAGYRDTDGTFDGALYTCFFWSSSEKNALCGQCRGIYNIDSNIGWSYLNKQDGFSVRCLRDT